MSKCACGCSIGECGCAPGCKCGCNHQKGGAKWAQAESFSSDRYIEKKPNCRCGAKLQWDKVNRAWYCIKCPFNTYPKKNKEFNAEDCDHFWIIDDIDFTSGYGDPPEVEAAATVTCGTCEKKYQTSTSWEVDPIELVRDAESFGAETVDGFVPIIFATKWIRQMPTHLIEQTERELAKKTKCGIYRKGKAFDVVGWPENLPFYPEHRAGGCKKCFDAVKESFSAESFNARDYMKGTDFDIGKDIGTAKKRYDERKTKEEILNMIEQIRERMEHYKSEYKIAKWEDDRASMVVSIRNWKALQGAHQALKWSLSEQGVEHPLY